MTPLARLLAIPLGILSTAPAALGSSPEPGSRRLACPVAESVEPADGPLGSRALSLDPTVVPLETTRPEVAGSGSVSLAMAGSPYGVAVASDGRYRTHLTVHLAGLLPREDVVYVAWAATPSLDRVARLGSVVSGSAEIEATVEWNKFLVFVTAEESADVERWRGPILMTAMSPSGKMHPKAGHGIFESYSYLC